MNQKRKISLVLSIIGMLMIGSACLLEYVHFAQEPFAETRHHEKVTLKDMMESRKKVEESKTDTNEVNQTEKEVVIQEALVLNNPVEVEKQEENKVENEEVQDVYLEYPQIVYEDMTLEQLGEKLNRSLKSTVSGYGPLFASKAIELGIDPYLAVAIMLHETGCNNAKDGCSYKVRACNNVGGQKGGPSCDGGEYKAYATLEEGIVGFMENLYTNYYAKGLTTTDTIARKYLGYSDTSKWIRAVNNYIEIIRAA